MSKIEGESFVKMRTNLGTRVSDQAGLNRGPLIQNRFIVTLYILLVRIE